MNFTTYSRKDDIEKKEQYARDIRQQIEEKKLRQKENHLINRHIEMNMLKEGLQRETIQDIEARLPVNQNPKRRVTEEADEFLEPI